jgi:hypothetical protein
MKPAFQPGYPEGHFALGLDLDDKGKLDGAIAEYGPTRRNEAFFGTIPHQLWREVFVR